MTISNDSVAITPGSGATIATHLVGGKEYQVVMPADENGNIIGSRNTYFYNIVSQVHVASANAVHWALFNATTSVVRITSIKQIPNITTAVTGIVFNWKLARTTAIGTGGTAQSAWLADLSQSALNENITMILKPSGGANEGVILRNYSLSSEETNAATIQIASKGGLELVPTELLLNGHGIVLNQNEGIRCVQITSSSAGNTGWLVGIAID